VNAGGGAAAAACGSYLRALLLRITKQAMTVAKIPISASPPITPPTIAPTGVEELDITVPVNPDVPDGLIKAPAVTIVEPDMTSVEPAVTIVEVYTTVVEPAAAVAVAGAWIPGGGCLPVLRPPFPVKVGKSRV
jgi:hypothetical protein